MQPFAQKSPKPCNLNPNQFAQKPTIRTKAEYLGDDELDDLKQQAEEILKGVREAAAEQGVTQEAYYFVNESSAHERSAVGWRKATITMSVILIVYGAASFFFHKIPAIAPIDLPESVQFVVSKFLIFFVLAYMRLRQSTNYMTLDILVMERPKTVQLLS